MNIQQRVRGILALMLMLVFLPGCGRQKEALEFNNKISSANKRIEDAATPFGKAVEQAMQGNANMVEVRRTFKNTQDVVLAVKTEAQILENPRRGQRRNLYDSHQRFMKAQDEAIALFGEFVKTLENNNLSPQQKAMQIQAGRKTGYTRETGRCGLAELPESVRQGTQYHASAWKLTGSSSRTAL